MRVRRKKQIVSARKPFVDGVIDIKRWKARQKWKRLRARLRAWLRRERGE